jgi:phospholipase/carboxylesterase
MRETELGGLRVRLAGGSDREGGGTGPVVILLHGFGAPGDDLAALYRVLDVPREARFVFPEAPLAPPDFAGYGGRAWWMIDTAAMQRAAMREEVRDRSNETPAGMADAHARVTDLLAAVDRELGAHGAPLVLGGFSQGAMLACDIALRSARPLAGLVLLSTTLLCKLEWLPRMAARAGLPILQTHGRADPLLPFGLATELRDALVAAGCGLEFLAFNGGHEVPMSVIQALGSFIRKVVV